MLEPPVQIRKRTLETTSLCKLYKGRKVLDDVTISLQEGEIVGLLGPNGAGKSTCCDIIAGRIKPDSGMVLLAGEPITHLRMSLRTEKGIAYLSNEPSILRNLSVEENLMAVIRTKHLSWLQQQDRIEELINFAGLGEVRRSKTRVLSGGQRRHLELARVLATDPVFIVLDEPFAGIDPIAQMSLQSLIQMLGRKGFGVLITDQSVRETLAWVDRAYLINTGQILSAGTPESILAKPELRRVYLGERFSFEGGYSSSQENVSPRPSSAARPTNIDPSDAPNLTAPLQPEPDAPFSENSVEGFTAAHFTLTAPKLVAAGEPAELRFWIHQFWHRDLVLKHAQEAHALSLSELTAKSEGPHLLQNGSTIQIRMRVKGIKCVDSQKSIVWNGEIGTATFVLDVPSDAKGACIGTASVRVNGLEIAKISFVLRVGQTRGEMTSVPTTINCHRNAFASYASEDRAEVLVRVQGMEAAYKGLKVFVDVIDLRAGDSWEWELYNRIREMDLFYLFWCRHSKESQWVQKEWQCALETKGIDFIDPIPLEDPKYASPPAELADKHFNDPFLAFIAAAGGVSSRHLPD